MIQRSPKGQRWDSHGWTYGNHPATFPFQVVVGSPLGHPQEYRCHPFGDHPFSLRPPAFFFVAIGSKNSGWSRMGLWPWDSDPMDHPHMTSRSVKSNKKWMETHRSPSNLTPELNFLSDRWVSPTRSARPMARSHIPPPCSKSQVLWRGKTCLLITRRSILLNWDASFTYPPSLPCWAFPLRFSLLVGVLPWGRRGSAQARGEGIRVSIFMSRWGALGGRIIHRYIYR